MSEQILSCDTVIIGAGSAGLEAYKAAVATGAKCILVESGPLGTSAKRTGDTPISALLSAGKKSHAFAELEKYGVKAKFDFVLDTENVLNNVRAVRAKDTSEVLSFIYRIPENCRLIGKAQFIDAFTIQVNDSHIVKFKTAVIATGTTPLIPFELNQYSIEEGVYSTNSLFDIDHLPSSIAIFGSSKEGLQIGQALAYLGVKVVVFGTHRLWELSDETVIDVAIDAFKKRFDIVLDSYMTAFERQANSGFGIYYLDASNYENYLGVETVLAASARYPKIEGLNLRELGITLTRHGCIQADLKTQQCSLKHIFAAGEVTDLTMTLAEAKRTGKQAGLNAAMYPNILSADLKSNVPLKVLYTEPELAIVGLSYDMVKERAKKGQLFISAEVRPNDGYFRSTHQEDGILRLYADEKSHEILGAEICMCSAGHLAQFIALAIAQKMTVEVISEFSFFSPSYEEILQKACQSIRRTLERKSQGR